MQTARRVVTQFLGTVVLFSALVGVVTSAALLLASAAGYLPYSDRPGPGWWGKVHWPKASEVGFFFGFAPWLAYFCAFFGCGFFVLGIVLGFASAPKWLIRTLGGLIGALPAGLAVAGAGWYVALASMGPDVGM